MIKAWSVYMPKEAKENVVKVLNGIYFNTGEQEKIFREKLCNFVHANYAIACNNGTNGLKIALRAAGVNPGDEVITTPYTFIATNTSILEVGAIPVFADIHYDTLNISVDSIASRITKKTKAIMVVHYAGLPVEMDDILQLSRLYNIPVIEDSAHALGSIYKRQYVGSIGDFTMFSLQVIKIITCGDGGAVTTWSEEYYDRLKRYTWYGVDRDKRNVNGVDPLSDDITELGYKANMNDITASIASSAIDHLQERLELRRGIGALYRRHLGELKKVTLTNCPDYSLPSYQIFPIHVQDRMQFRKYMHDNEIEVIINNRRNDKYTLFGGIRNDLINTEMADSDTILIPCHTNLSRKEIYYIIDKIHQYDKL